jgi:hypothetical protein
MAPMERRRLLDGGMGRCVFMRPPGAIEASNVAILYRLPRSDERKRYSVPIRPRVHRFRARFCTVVDANALGIASCYGRYG